VRQLLTNLIRNGKITTTGKRAKVLKSEANAFFSRLLRIYRENEAKDARRESIRYVKSVIYGEPEGKKVLEKILPKYQAEGAPKSFVADYKIGYRPGDAAEKILLKLL
jgi:ribosomal protein L17